uniref:GPI transamidase component PIG-S n=1 Tax=Vannella robusta TaxID=1487602 RepID=A0A7S4HKN8_9EUKA|mmetsp:Transcript_12/g.16  ORF Transcript_12/g.16 Transcript_12/m.16 type:complete len:540 (+) Transcript_12:189-1808(+)
MSKHEGFHLPKRLWVTLSFAMMFLLGVPIWWKSTEIYRAELPYEEIEHWNERKAYDEPFRVMLDLYVPPSWNNENSKSILSNALREYETQSSEALYAIHYQSSLFPMSDLSPLSEYSCDAVHGRIEQMNPTNNGRYAFVSVPVDATQNLPKFTICPTRVVLMRMEKDSNTQESENWLRSVAEIAARKLISSPNTEDKDRKKIQSNSAFRLTFSLLQDTAGWDQPITTWDFPYYANGLLESFLTQIRATADVQVDSQIKFFVPLQRTPLEGDNYHYFTSSMLPHILAHPNEWNSDFTATTEPSLHFIVYVPPVAYTPLVLQDDPDEDISMSSQAYIIPQTGGVVIYNRVDNGTNPFLSKDMMHDVIEIFVAQLRELFGISPLYDLSQLSEKSIEMIPSPFGISQWERDQLLRERTYENLHLATVNLHSLSEMVQKLTNMMISDELQATVIESLAALSTSHEAIREGNYELAQEQSKLAMHKAHEAFFDPDMLSLLYFPDEHKFAIYTPLFLPISIPMFLKLVSETKRLRKKRAESKKKKE